MAIEREIKKYQRYNRLLANSLNNYRIKNKDMLESDDYSKKYELICKLKEELDNSAVINQKIPSKYVPMKQVYKKVYSLLFKSSFFGKSYLGLLELCKEMQLKGMDLKDIEKKIKAFEQKIILDINKELMRAGLNKHSIPKKIFKSVDSIFKELIYSSMFKIKRPFPQVISFLFVVFICLNFAGNSFAYTANKAFVSDEKKIEIILQKAKELSQIIKANTVFQFNSSREMPSQIELSLNKQDRALVSQKAGLINEWLVETKIVDMDLWRKLAGGINDTKSFENALDVFKKQLQSRVGDGYLVSSKVIISETKISEGMKKEIVSTRGGGGEIAYTGLSCMDFISLVQSLSYHQIHSREIIKKRSRKVFLKGGGMYKTRQIACTLDYKGNLVFEIIFLEDYYKDDYKKGSREEKINQYSRIAAFVISPIDQL